MALKYAAELHTCSGFLQKFAPVDERPAYRFSHADINDPRNYLPLYLCDPKRKKYDEKKGISGCDGWSLSCYETQSAATEVLERHLKDKPLLAQKLGTHIMAGTWSAADGISGALDDHGHYDHFENDGVDLSGRFSIVVQANIPDAPSTSS